MVDCYSRLPSQPKFPIVINNVDFIREPDWIFPTTDIHDIVLVFEEPHNHLFEKCNRLVAQKSQDPFNRWLCCHTLHVLFPPEKEDVTQLYLIRQANLPHYGENVDILLCKIKKFYLLHPSHPFTVQMYTPDRDHRNSFIEVINSNAESYANWPKLTEAIPRHINAYRPKGKDAIRRSEHYSDAGFATNMNSTRVLSTSGHSKPQFRDGTGKVFIKLFLCAMSAAVLKFSPIWMEGEKLLEDPANPERSAMYGNHLGPGNVFEGCAFNINNLEHKLNLHYDEHQPRELSLSCLMGVNVIHNHHRYSGVAYQRSSCSNASARVSTFGPLLEFFDQSVEYLGEERKSVASVVSSGAVSVMFPGYEIRTSPCNLDTSGFHSITIYALVVMQHELQLPLPELVGLATAFEVVPNTGIHFAMACNVFLFYASCCKGQKRHNQHIIGIFEHYELGYMIGKLAALLKQEYDCRKKEAKRISALLKARAKRKAKDPYTGPIIPKCPEVCCCYFYSQPLLPDTKTWITINNYKLFHVLAAATREPSKSARTKSPADYSTFVKTFLKKTKGLGDFFTMHSVSILSKAGLLPYKFSSMAELQPSKRTVGWLRDHFKLSESLRTATDCNRLLSTMAKRYSVTLSVAENLVCKGYRVRNSIIPDLNDKTGKDDGDGWVDVSLPFQSIFEMKSGDEHNIAYLPDGTLATAPSGGLLSTFPYGCEEKTIAEISGMLEDVGIDFSCDWTEENIEEGARDLNRRRRCSELFACPPDHRFPPVLPNWLPRMECPSTEFMRYIEDASMAPGLREHLAKMRKRIKEGKRK